MKICRNLILLLLSLTLLLSCTPAVAPNPTPTEKPTEEPTATITPTPTQHEEEEMTIDADNTVETLGLCVTDGNFSEISVGKAEMRFRDYVRIGIRTVRIETVWTSPAPGQWTLDDAYVKLLRAAVRAGLRLKLILPTIMKPPSRIFNDEGARLVNEDGTLSLQNTVSYWYDGLTDYTEDAIRCMLTELSRLEILDSVDGIVVDFGPAGEPLYPAMWTQNTAREMLWCYGDNAQADFRAKMQEKYGTVGIANDAWGTAYTSFETVTVPKPGAVRGAMWEDVLTWYRNTKRDFVDRQTSIFRNAVDELTDGRIQLILYMPGEAYTESDWNTAVATGGTTTGVCICSENEFIVQTAAKYGTLLQFTGLPGTTSVKKVLAWMADNGYWEIPVYGENYADTASGSDPVGLGKICNELGLAGIDYTFTSYLYDSTGYKKNEVFTRFENAVPYFISAIVARRKNAVPEAIAEKEAAPEGSILCFSLQNISAGASASVTLSFPAYTVEAGDLLEYDIYIPEGVTGIGMLDGNVTGKIAFSANAFATLRDGQSPADAEAIAVRGRWVHCQIALGIDYNPFDVKGNYVGCRLSSLKLLAAPAGAEETEVFIDNVVVTNSGEIKYTVFADAGDFGAIKCTEIASDCTATLQTKTFPLQ